MNSPHAYAYTYTYYTYTNTYTYTHIKDKMLMTQRSAINPWTWSVHYGFNQGELVVGNARSLYCSGQTAVDGQGRPQHAGDMKAQLGLALDNLETVLLEAHMSLANVVRLVVYTTDVDGLIREFGVLASRLGAAGASPAQTLLGVSRLFLPSLLVELEATAVA